MHLVVFDPGRVGHYQFFREITSSDFAANLPLVDNQDPVAYPD
jgi:hypothetical protein